MLLWRRWLQSSVPRVNAYVHVNVTNHGLLKCSELIIIAIQFINKRYMLVYSGETK